MRYTMSKAVLVIDMPKSCSECKIRFDDEYSQWCPYDNPEPNGVWRYVEKATKPDWCPLKPMPRMKFTYIDHDSTEKASYNQGWNGCVNEIL